jgi:hypothetical protein
MIASTEKTRSFFPPSSSKEEEISLLKLLSLGLMVFSPSYAVWTNELSIFVLMMKFH